MDLFNNAKAVQLRSHQWKYLYADEDEYSVTQNRNGSSENSRWTVELVDNIPEKNIIRLKSCNGKYLTASNQRFLLGLTGRKVLQTLPRSLDYSVEWEPIREGDQVKLKTRYGRFLRANGIAPPYRNSVTHDDPLLSFTQDWILWDVEVVDIVIRSPQSDSFSSSESNSISTHSILSASSSRQHSAPTDKCFPIQLINEEGVLDVTAIETFEKQVRLAESGNYYSVVSIMGPQSSGKSTLLNHLFGTNFREMNAVENRCQTTKGIWLAKCPDIERCTLVMDLEGTDGRERGVDDTAFEKQAALFALAASDIILINMWCHDIGREQAANKPLLRTVFEVMGKLLGFGKTTLLFVIRDKSEKSPMKILEDNLKKDVLQIWNSFDKPDGHELTPLEEIFNVKIVALPHYEMREDQFKEQVASLRQQFFSSFALGKCAGDRREEIPAPGFSCSVQKIWKAIRENNNLGLPSHKHIKAIIAAKEEVHTAVNVKKPISKSRVVARLARVAIQIALAANGINLPDDLCSSLPDLFSSIPDLFGSLGQ